MRCSRRRARGGSADRPPGARSTAPSPGPGSGAAAARVLPILAGCAGVLLANAVLDVGYLAIGARLRRTENWRDDGLAVLVQAGFLLVLDTAAAARLR